MSALVVNCDPCDTGGPPVPTTWEAGTDGAWRWGVWLDGEHVPQALTADVRTGVVTEAVLDANGMLDVKAGYAHRTRRGTVDLVAWNEWRRTVWVWAGLLWWMTDQPSAAGANRQQSDTASETDRTVAALFADTAEQPCAECRAEARQGQRTAWEVQAGTGWREASEPGAFRTWGCAEHGGQA